MSTSRVLSQLALRRGRAVPLTSSTSATARKLPSSATTLHCRRPLNTSTPPRPSYPVAALTTSSTLWHGLSQLGRGRSSTLTSTFMNSSLRCFSSTAPLSSSEGSTGPRPMKVAIIGQSLFGREVHVLSFSRGATFTSVKIQGEREGNPLLNVGNAS